MLLDVWLGGDTLASEAIADEWLCLTFSHDDRCVVPLRRAMMLSREAAVDYMMPLGLHHLFAFGHHYGPSLGGIARVCVPTGCHRIIIGPTVRG